MNRRNFVKNLALAAPAGLATTPLVASAGALYDVTEPELSKTLASGHPYDRVEVQIQGIPSVAGYPQGTLDGSSAHYWNLKVDDVDAVRYGLDLDKLQRSHVDYFTNVSEADLVMHEMIRHQDFTCTWLRGIFHIAGEHKEQEMLRHQLLFVPYEKAGQAPQSVWDKSRRMWETWNRRFFPVDSGMVLHTYYLNQKLRQDFLCQEDVDKLKAFYS